MLNDNLFIWTLINQTKNKLDSSRSNKDEKITFVYTDRNVSQAILIIVSPLVLYNIHRLSGQLIIFIVQFFHSSYVLAYLIRLA